MQLPGVRLVVMRLNIQQPYLYAFSFMNSKWYKPMLNKRREVPGRACYLCFAAYLLPIRCARVLLRSIRRLPLSMELLDRRGATLYRPCVLRALAFGYWDARSLFSSAERADATRRRCNMSSHSGSSGGIRFGDCLANAKNKNEPLQM